jgi:hypothetical protein
MQNFYHQPTFLKFFYFNKETIHSILYETDAVISIDSIKNDNLYFISHLYLSLLIEDHTNVINYSYPFELIKNINEIQTKTEKKDNIKKIFLSKMIMTLIINYEQNDSNDITNVENDIIRYKKYNNDIINDNEALLKKFKLSKKDILSKKIDEIYSSIIKQLIIMDQLNLSENTKKIMNYLDLENFNITKKIFEELKDILNKEKDYIKKYRINKFEDIFNEEIITFYYVLFKYILKNSLYIYQIPFLLQTRNNILKYIKKNIDKLKTNLENNSNNIDKIKYVLNYFIEFEYYNEISLKKKDENSNISGAYSSYNNNSNMVSNSQSNYNEVGYSSSGPFGKSYQNEKERSGRSLGQLIESSEYDIIKNIFGKEKPYQILENSTFHFHTNRKGKNPLIICDEIYIGNEKTNYSLDEIEKFSLDDKKKYSNTDVENLEENYKKFIGFLDKIKNKIEKEFSFRYKFKFTLQFKTNFIENHKFKIDCIYTAYIPNEDFLEYKDENIIEKGASNGITLLLSEITNDAYNDLEYED